MGLLTSLLTLPVSGPLRGAFWVAEKIAEQAVAEHNSPEAIEAALAALEQDLLAGRIDEETFEDAEDALLSRLASRGQNDR